ncbi:hypothetical protein CUZ56_01389 [Saezia sanguinis]|uniref:Coproporphyrinogen III oxidase n=1 Tax=Saezia sanguinis TaxID=1965230 RepID=A0A433SFM3_9BURK|nr:DUF2857 domain-containing protein [Saezia sanguinis]RUS67444.1 hypothetical protein CUZ56_01389 [Saezia sanguinis]
MMNSTQPLNQAVIAQVLNDLRNGQLRRCLSMGFSHEDIALLRQPELVSVLLNTKVTWVNVVINVQIMRRLLTQAHNVEKEISLIDRLLVQNASSKMICEIFGLNQREVAFRRHLLGLTKKRGRWLEITERQEHALWRRWKTLKDAEKLNVNDTFEMVKVCLTLAEESSLPIASIWPVMQEWINEGLL